MRHRVDAIVNPDPVYSMEVRMTVGQAAGVWEWFHTHGGDPEQWPEGLKAIASGFNEIRTMDE